jgi:AraC-like DNA-binding protein
MSFLRVPEPGPPWALLPPFSGRGHVYRCHRYFNVTVASTWSIPLREISDLHLLLVQGGTGSYEIAGREWSLRRGDLILLGPGIEHGAKTSPRDPLRFFALRYGVYGRSPQKTGKQALPRGLFHHARPNAFLELERMLARLDQLRLRQDPRFTIWFDLALQQAMALLEIESAPGAGRFQKVIDAYASDPARRFNLRELSALCGLNPTWFSEAFSATYGMGPKELEIRLRLEYACFLLGEQGLSVRETAERLGYPDAFIFSRQFRKMYGIPPKCLLSGASL